MSTPEVTLSHLILYECLFHWEYYGGQSSVADDAVSLGVHCALSDCDVEIVQLPLGELTPWINGNNSSNPSYLVEILKAFLIPVFTIYFTPQCSGVVSRYKSYAGYILRVLCSLILARRYTVGG